jgi:uncharacterized MAPEG superfamily protein
MNIPVLCVFITSVLPVCCSGFAKISGGFQMSHNKNPRDFLSSLEGRSARANAAQMNGWESFPQFAAAVIFALYFCGPAELIDNIAIAFVVIRVLYSISYIIDYSKLRSLLFFAGIACIWSLFYLAITA